MKSRLLITYIPLIGYNTFQIRVFYCFFKYPDPHFKIIGYEFNLGLLNIVSEAKNVY